MSNYLTKLDRLEALETLLEETQIAYTITKLSIRSFRAGQISYRQALIRQRKEKLTLPCGTPVNPIRIQAIHDRLEKTCIYRAQLESRLETIISNINVLKEEHCRQLEELSNDKV